MLTTASPASDTKSKRLRPHDMHVPDTVRHRSPRVIFEEYLEVGFNYRMTGVQTAAGRKQPQRQAELVARRRGTRLMLCRTTRKYRRFAPPQNLHGAHSNWQSYCVRLPSRSTRGR